MKGIYRCEILKSSISGNFDWKIYIGNGNEFYITPEKLYPYSSRSSARRSARRIVEKLNIQIEFKEKP